MNYTVLQLFSMPVAICHQSFTPTKQMFDKIKKINKFRPNEGKNKSSLDTKILEDEIFKPLKTFVTGHLKNYAHRFFHIKEKVNFYVTQSWLNFNDKETYHHLHSHPNSIISGVYYFSGENTNITFHRDRGLFPGFLFDYNKFDIFNSEEYTVDIKPGQLILFPSSLKHSVKINTSSKQRISLAFNSFITGDIGEENLLTKIIINNKGDI